MPEKYWTTSDEPERGHHDMGKQPAKGFPTVIALKRLECNPEKRLLRPLSRWLGEDQTKRTPRRLQVQAEWNTKGHEIALTRPNTKERREETCCGYPCHPWNMLNTAQYRQKETANPATAQTDDAANSAGHVLDSSVLAEGSRAPKEQAQGQGAAEALPRPQLCS